MYACRDSRPFISGTTPANAWILDEVQSSGYNQENNLFVASIAPAYLRAAIGLMLRNKKNFQAYSTDEEFSDETDVMNDAMQWAASVSRYNPQFALAFEDACVRGFGGFVTYLDFSHRNYPLGVPVTQRKFHLMFDRGGQDDIASHVTKWNGYADPMYRDALDDYIESQGGFEEDGDGASFRDQLLEYTSSEDQHEIDFVYHYFWREWTTVYDTENPFVTRANELLQGADISPEILELLSAFANNHQVDISRSSLITLDYEGHRAFRDMIDNFEFLTGQQLENVKSTSRKARMYYRCQIADGKIIKGTKSPSYTQECHPLNIISAYFDRTTGRHYGLMRAAAYFQEALNDVMKDTLTYTNRAATGGTIGITGAGSELKDTIQSIRKKEQAFPLPPDAGITGLQTADAAAVYQNTSALLLKLIPMSMGLPQEIIGMMNSDTPAASLFKAVVDQMSVSLSHIMYNVDASIYNQGLIFRDLTIDIAQAGDSIVLPRLSPAHNEQAYFVLSKENIARNYAMRIVESDTSEDQRHDQFLKIVEFARMLPDAQRAAVSPELIKLSNFDEQSKDSISQLLQPPPVAPEEAQMAKELQKANTRMINAQAAQLESQALLDAEQAPTKMERELALLAKDKAETDKKRAEIDLTEARTMQAEVEAGAKMAGI